MLFALNLNKVNPFEKNIWICHTPSDHSLYALTSGIITLSFYPCMIDDHILIEMARV